MGDILWSDKGIPMQVDHGYFRGAILSRLQPKDPIPVDFHCLDDLPGIIDVMPLVKHVHATIDAAVRTWAEKCKMTPEKWLEYFLAKYSIEVKDGQMTVTVRADVRGGDHVDPVVVPTVRV